jgi:tetratricopeptide (TPR) repeat protein
VGERGTLTLAQEALDLVQVDPGQAVRVATGVARTARSRGELDAASVAERALGLAAVHLQDLPAATRHLRAAMALAERQGRPDLAAEARMTFAFALNRHGRPGRALTEIEAALTDLGPSSRARGLTQRAAILQQLGRLDEALVDYRAALTGLRRAGDLVWVQRVLLNRGVLHAFRHSYTAALRDLHEAEHLCTSLGLSLPAAFVQENLVLVHRRLGDVPTALGHLDRAERLYRSLGAPLGSLLLEGSELMLSVGLVSEAREAAEKAVADFVRTGRHLSTPEARLLLARTAVLDGDPQVGVAQARRAVRELTRQGRTEWAALARCALVLARLEVPDGPRVTLRQLTDVADEAQDWGWPATALDLRLAAGQVGLAGPHRAQARQQLELASGRRRRGPAASRAKAWLATALLRQDGGNVAGSSAAAARGLQILDDYRATMAATDLRARVSRLGIDLARLGLRNALDGGCPDEVLVWAERGRARHLLHPPALRPNDPGLTLLLAELRTVVAEQSEHQRTGQPLGRLLGRQEELEHEIRDAMRRQPAQAGPTALQHPAQLVDSLGAALQGAALVEYVELDDHLYAACVAGGESTLRRLGPSSRIRDRVRWLPFALLRLSRHEAGAASADAAVALVRRVAADLDAALLHPVAPEVGARPLVLVPTGPLQSMPWSLLPSLAGRPVAVAPSATLWAAAAGRSPQAGPVTVVAGPGLPGARREAVEVAAVYGAEPLLGPAATVEAVTTSLQAASLLHLAAHGTVRADNPLFSSLRLFDGPLTVYDLERLDHSADTVVLAACESGRDVVLAGDELLGLSATFLSRTTRRVVASVVPVPDAATAPLMVQFHRLMAHGVPVADSLAQAQCGIGQDHPAAFAAAAGFVCLGAGFDVAPRAVSSVP